MAKERLAQKIRSRLFYVTTYRKAGTVLVISLAVNLLVGLAIGWVHFHMPERQFYASNGASPPTQLVPLDQPNMGSTPALGTASEVT